MTDETGTEEAPVEGSCGDSLTWAFDAGTGTLAINGSGAMYDYEIDYNTFTTTAPWIAHKDNITSLVLSDGITYIGNYAFGLCGNISGSLVIPDSVTAIGTGAFVNCWGFDGTLTLPENLTAIPDSAFENCDNFTGTLEIPEKVTSIGIYAFYGNGFTAVTIHEGVTSIGDCAFFKCRNLTELTIPSTVTNIDSGAFAGCSGVTEIIFAGTTVPVFTDMPINPFSSMTALTKIKVPAVSYDAYAAALTGMVADTVEIVKYGEEPPCQQEYRNIRQRSCGIESGYCLITGTYVVSVRCKLKHPYQQFFKKVFQQRKCRYRCSKQCRMQVYIKHWNQKQHNYGRFVESHCKQNTPDKFCHFFRLLLSRYLSP